MEQSVVAQFAPLVLIMVVFYFLIMRPQQKKFKAHQAMLADLKVGEADHESILVALYDRGRLRQERLPEDRLQVVVGQRLGLGHLDGARLPRDLLVADCHHLSNK